MSNDNRKISEDVAELAGEVTKVYVQSAITRLKWAAIVAGVLAIFVLLCVVFK